MRTFSATIKEKVYLGPVRALLRRMGLGRVRGLPRAVNTLVCRVRFRIKPRDNVIVRIGNLVAKFPVSSSSEMCQMESLNGEKRLVQKMIGKIRTGDVVYDIGTNIGVYTVFLAAAVEESGKVVGFEPELRCYRRCQENLRINSAHNVQLFGVALGQVETTAELVVRGEAGSGVHHISRQGESSSDAVLQPVRVVVGDAFVVEQQLPFPTVLKIDVEGMELEVLTGFSQTLRRPECRLVCCEIHFSILEQRGHKDVPRRIMEFLAQTGFQRIEWVDWSHCFAFKD